MVLTALGRVRSSASALYAADRDRTARSVRYAYTLKRQARVHIEVTDAAGDVVRTMGPRTQSRGGREWTWDGRDQAGRFVAPGSYRVLLTVTTTVGTMRVDRSVFVGPYRIRVSDATPRRGQKVRIRVDATERQKGRPVLVIAQPGGGERRVRTKPDGHGEFVATVRLRSAGDPGTLRIQAVGRDDRGHRESQALELPLP